MSSTPTPPVEAPLRALNVLGMQSVNSPEAAKALLDSVNKLKEAEGKRLETEQQRIAANKETDKQRIETEKQRIEAMDRVVMLCGLAVVVGGVLAGVHLWLRFREREYWVPARVAVCRRGSCPLRSVSAVLLAPLAHTHLQ